MSGGNRVKSIEELLAEQPVIDNNSLLGRLWGIMGELKRRLGERFDLHPVEEVAEFKRYGSPEGPRGELFAFRGPDLDYVAYSWIGNPALGFTNMHLNIWLHPRYRVPDLGIVFGTVPQLFFYMDYVPRADLWLDHDYMDRYFSPLNPRFLELHNDPRLKPFISQEVWIRQAASPCAYSFTAETSDETVELARRLAHEMMDRWLGWLETPEMVSGPEEEALNARRLETIRKTHGYRDPANPIGEKFFGKEMAQRLLEALWGVRL